MAFKPVTGEQLKDFDEETRSLYARRENDPRLSYVLSVIARRERHNLPVVVDSENNSYIQDLHKKASGFQSSLLWQYAFFLFACQRFSKAYYPYGIIVRRAVPTSPLTQASYYGPLLAFFAYQWWMHKEYPRRQRCDLTCDSEN